ncbi:MULTISPECIES: GNAT family N-acetyltransferase [Clostridium]|uniref:GNAT family N-acetyltransferase n=1 Tax=Clostridium TaxID=1485 RepID=UPI0013E953A1|nr:MULTISPECIES: GNAT family N-acetyltransferase [Clostridium]MBU3128060.1 GNAT family N-acetyltransferase [Clostridium tagluense]MBW9156688.1 GNAT family N-acetyltransferase [Clostridium tagluense]MBZ9636489.1 GNAT family N-acetyltransferase [Clostridium sp. FP1]WLC64850.1 GNAT family N-acetyltransferase [Clostridium tagluense]
MVKINTIKNNEIDKLAEFIEFMNSKENYNIGYCEKTKEKVLNALYEDFEDGNIEKYFVGAYDGEKLIGVLGIDVEEEKSYGELWGPFVEELYSEENVSSKLWLLLRKNILNCCASFGIFCNSKNIQCIQFAKEYGFKNNGEHFIMSLGRDDFKEIFEVKDFELTFEYNNEFKLLHDKNFPNTYYSGSDILSRINERRKVFFIKDNEKLIGYTYVEVEPEFGESCIEFFGVRENMRGKGLGGKLIKIAINWILSFEKIGNIRLCVGLENLQAIGLYSKVGFKEESKMLFYKN